ncbi:MAG TPA: YbdD/YjiX family protein [Gallionella sp.]|nr:YbdD/YjiX family protein [Gallionella sp.]
MKVSLRRNSLRSFSRSLRSVHLALKPLATVLRSLGRGWRIIRRLSGDDGYERYLTHYAATHPDTPALPRREWFAHQQRQKWSGIKRCC